MHQGGSTTWLFKARCPRIEMERYMGKTVHFFWKKKSSPKKLFPKEPIQATHLPKPEETSSRPRSPYLLHDHPHLFLHGFTEAAHVDVLRAARSGTFTRHPRQGLQKSRLRHPLLVPAAGWSVGSPRCSNTMWRSIFMPKICWLTRMAEEKEWFLFCFFCFISLIVQNSGNDMQSPKYKMYSEQPQYHVYSRDKQH